MTTDTTEAVQAARRILEYWGPDYGNEDEVIVARALLSLAERDLIEESAALVEQCTDIINEATARKLGCRIRTLRTSPLPARDLIEEAARVADELAAAEEALAEHYKDAGTGQRESCLIRAAAQRFTAAAIRALRASPAPSPWRPMPKEKPGVYPFTGERTLVGWDDSATLPMHVELGRWRSGSGKGSGWCNTYGHSFGASPTHYMPLPAPPKGGE